jgi:hypothetical protein
MVAKADRSVGAAGGRREPSLRTGPRRMLRLLQGPQTRRMQLRQWCRRFVKEKGDVQSRQLADALSSIHRPAPSIVYGRTPTAVTARREMSCH